MSNKQEYDEYEYRNGRGTQHRSGTREEGGTPAPSASATSSRPYPPASLTTPILTSQSRCVLVTGGSGFLGRHLIQTLLGLGHAVRCFDIVPGVHDPKVTVYQGDITEPTDEALLIEACTEVDTVFHTASLTDPLADLAAIRRVNVHGTQQVLNACIATGVRNLIYTSTTSVIFAGRDIEGLTEEECPYPRSYMDPYSCTKAEAEKLVIAANGTRNQHGQTLCTVSLRPHAIFGPRDTHFIAALISRARNGDITHMIGSGQNRVDWTYVGNVIHAMVITMHQLSDPCVASDHDLGSDYIAARARIGGQCYFITNGEPRPFWQFINTMLNEVGCVGPTKSISFSIAYFIAFLMEWLQWFLRRLPSFMRIKMESTITRHVVCVLAKSQWYSCAKAQRDLGYDPIISLDQGLEITINYFFRRKNVKNWKPQIAHPHAHAHQTHATHHSSSAHAGGSGHASHAPLAHSGSLHAVHGHMHGHAAAGPTHAAHSFGTAGVLLPGSKVLPRIHSVPTPTYHDIHTSHHTPYATSAYAHQTHEPHAVMRPQHAYMGAPVDHAASPSRYPPQWPHRHWSTSPTFDPPSLPSSSLPQSHHLAHTRSSAGRDPAGALHPHPTLSHTILVAPHPVRGGGGGMKQIPSVAYMDAYDLSTSAATHISRTPATGNAHAHAHAAVTPNQKEGETDAHTNNNQPNAE